MKDENWSNIKRKVQTVGMSTYVEYYYDFEKSTKQELLSLFEQNKNWSPSSVQAKASAGLAIFEEKINKEALEIILSSNPGQKTIEKATEIYTNEFPGKEFKKIHFIRPEFEFGEQIIKKLFAGYEIKPQFNVLGSKIDWYIPELKIAIEFDEKHHKRNKKDDSQRQSNIEKLLDCKFLRYSY